MYQPIPPPPSILNGTRVITSFMKSLLFLGNPGLIPTELYLGFLTHTHTHTLPDSYVSSFSPPHPLEKKFPLVWRYNLPHLL
jgi:hypothetical protein